MAIVPQDDEDAPIPRPSEEGIKATTWALVGLLLVLLYILAVIVMQPRS